MKVGPVLGAVLSLAATAGCSDSRAVSGVVERTDSAGVEIVVLGGPQVELDIVDELHFESASERLTRVEQLVADSTGGAWALDSNVRGVLRFSDAGEMRTFGAAGSGPGEFENPWRLTLAQDTLWVADIGTDRITGLDPETGELLSSISGFDLWRALPEAEDRSMTPIGVTEDGAVLVATEDPGSGQIVIAELGRSGPPTRREVIRLDRGGDNLEVATPGPGIITMNNPFSRGDLLTLDDRGRYVGRLRQASSFEAHLVPLRDARHVIRLSWPDETRPVTDAERESWLSGWASTFASRGIFPGEDAARQAIDDALEDALRTDSAPYVRRRTRGIFERGTFIDDADGVWIEDWSVGEAPAHWHRLDELGTGVELTLGPDEILLDVTGRFVWKQRFDSLRVPHLTRLTVDRPHGREDR